MRALIDALRFRRRRKRVTRLPYAPGARLDLVDGSGRVFAALVLSEVFMDYTHGTTVAFVDLGRYMDKRTIQ